MIHDRDYQASLVHRDAGLAEVVGLVLVVAPDLTSHARANRGSAAPGIGSGLPLPKMIVCTVDPLTAQRGKSG